MKRLIITEEEKKSILLKHGSKSLINEADADVQAIQTAVGVKADGVAGPKTVNAILTKLGGSSTPAATTTTPTTAPTTSSTTPVASTTTPTTPVSPTTPTTPAATTATTGGIDPNVVGQEFNFD